MLPNWWNWGLWWPNDEGCQYETEKAVEEREGKDWNFCQLVRGFWADHFNFWSSSLFLGSFLYKHNLETMQPSLRQFRNQKSRCVSSISSIIRIFLAGMEDKSLTYLENQISHNFVGILVLIGSGAASNITKRSWCGVSASQKGVYWELKNQGRKEWRNRASKQFMGRKKCNRFGHLRIHMMQVLLTAETRKYYLKLCQQLWISVNMGAVQENLLT